MYDSDQNPRFLWVLGGLYASDDCCTMNMISKELYIPRTGDGGVTSTAWLPCNLLTMVLRSWSLLVRRLTNIIVIGEWFWWWCQFPHSFTSDVALLLSQHHSSSYDSRRNLRCCFYVVRSSPLCIWRYRTIICQIIETKGIEQQIRYGNEPNKGIIEA